MPHLPVVFPRSSFAPRPARFKGGATRRDPRASPSPASASFRNGAFRNGGSGANGKKNREDGAAERTAPSPASHRSPSSSASSPAARRGEAPLGAGEAPFGAGEPKTPSANPETVPLFDTYDGAEYVLDGALLMPPPHHPRDSPTTVPSDGTRTPKYRFDRGKGVSRWPAFLSTSWEFDEDLAMARGAMAPLLAAPWRLMLLSDGSVTRHLQLLTDAKVVVDVLSHDAVRLEDVARDPTVPPDVAKILAADIPFPERSGEDPDFSGTTGSIDESNPIDESSSMEPKGTTTIDSCTHLLHREVDLCDGRDGTPLVYASSWWTPEAAERFGILRPDGAATERAVWMHLSERRTELFREVRRLYRGASPALEEAWGEAGPFWGRHYVFWAGEVPLCVIYEVFSPRLGGFLGGCEADGEVVAKGRRDERRSPGRTKEEAA